MMRTDKLGAIMEIIFEDCSGCPLEKICKDDCETVWTEFLNSKVKEDGIET